MPLDAPLPFACVAVQPTAAERMVAVSLALEDALAREAWHEADDLFAARDDLLARLPAHAIPREVDEIDLRILARLEKGQAEIRRETLALTTTRRATAVYEGPLPRTSLLAA